MMRQSVRLRRKRRPEGIYLQALEARRLLTVFTPAAIRTAYGFDKISADGTGQTIALIEAYNDTHIAADLNTFDTTYGIAGGDASNFLTVATFGTQQDTGWGLETSLDVEWAHAIAPGAKLLVVQANSSSISDLMTAVDYARNYAGVSVVSMSWGSGEFSTETSLDSHFTTPNGHTNVAFFASSGDSGKGTEWPAASPNVIGVGGTSLYLNPDGSYSYESAWSGSGGGISQYETKPSYQANVTLSSTQRTVPDVAYDADPNTGFPVYDGNYNGQAGWLQVGGTSAGAPQWAALVALANQERGTNLATSDVLNTLYNSTGILHDVTSGSNGYSAGTGYDLVTGLGTPIANAVVAKLAGNSIFNGSFESPSVGSFLYDPGTGASGWTFTGSGGIQSNGSAFAAPNAPDGTQTAFLQGSGSQISQSIFVASDATYHLQFQSALRSYKAAGTSNQQIALYIDGSLAGVFSPTSASSWNTFSVAISAGTHTISFQGVNGGDTTTFLDAVKLVAQVDHAPVAQNDSKITTQGVPVSGTLPASDPDGDTLTYSTVSGPTHGTLTAFNAATGAYTYTPSAGYIGSDSFTYKANDGILDSNVATVSITINPASTGVTNGSFELPAVGAIVYSPAAPGWTFSGGSGIQANGSAFGAPAAPDGTQTAFLQGNGNQITQSISVASDTTYRLQFQGALRSYKASGTSNQQIALYIDGNLAGVFSPASTTAWTTFSAAISAGSHTISFQGVNGGDTTAFLDAVQLVSQVDHAPVAQNDSKTTTQGVPVNGTLPASDPDGDSLTYSIVSGPTNGTLTSFSPATGAYTYTPASGYTGADSFTFKANDGTLDSNVATVSITINPASAGVTDGGFETPTVGSIAYAPSAPGWTFSGGSGIQTNGSAFGAPNAPEGTQTAFLQGNSGQITQSISVPNDVPHQLQFMAALRAYKSAGAQNQQIALYIDGTLAGTFSPTSASSWNTFSVAISAGSHTISFKGVNGGDTTAFLDAVTIV
jgi:Bacterial Ig domain